MSDSSNSYNGGQILAAFLGGAAAGAVVALLTAPKSGKAAREDVKHYLEEKGHDAARLPDALKAAGEAAKDAFSESLHPAPLSSSKGSKEAEKRMRANATS